MSSKSTKSKTTKRTPKQKAYDDAVTELMLAIGEATTEDKIGLMRQMSSLIAQEGMKRKRRISDDKAREALQAMIEHVNSPDIPVIIAEEITEYIRMEDLHYDKDRGIVAKFKTPLEIVDGEPQVDFVLKNLKVKDFIALELDPAELYEKGGTLAEKMAIVERVIGCTSGEAEELCVADVNRIWGLFATFFLGR